MRASQIVLRAILVAAAVTIGAFGAAENARAESKVVATVNGQPITELDLQLAETEIGRDLGQLPAQTRRRVLVEYLIENFLFAKAAEDAQLDTGPAFDDRMRYMRRRALRETYFEDKIRKSVSEAAAKTFYKDRVKGMKPQEEVKARHILVPSEEVARDLAEQIARGGDFAELAKQHSADPGTKGHGGMLGYFARGQMVPAFEQAAFELKPGEVSEPVQSKFGWHLIKVEDRRQKPIPTFEEVREQILNSLIHQQTQAEAERLRQTAKIDYVDPEIKKEVEAQKKREDAQRLEFERRVREMHKKEEQGGAGGQDGAAKKE